MWALPPADPGVEVTVSSHGMSKGISQTDDAQFIARPFIRIGDIQVGGQWKNVNSNSANGEASAFANLTRKLGDLQLTAGLAYKTLTGGPSGIDSDCVELTAGASQKLGRAAVRINAIFSPDDIGSTKRSLYVEGGPSLDVTKTIRLSANLGDRWRPNGVSYTAMNAGASFNVRKEMSLDLRYYRTNRSELGDIYRNRVVLSGKLTF